MMKDFPEGFAWTCCGRKHYMSGCKKSIHRPDRSKRVRRKRPARNHTFRSKMGRKRWRALGIWFPQSESN
jgi:hypothetical protein